MGRLDKCQLSKTPSEEKLACRYTFKKQLYDPYAFQNCRPQVSAKASPLGPRHGQDELPGSEAAVLGDPQLRPEPWGLD